MKFKSPELKDFGPKELPEPGPHLARLVGIVDLGMQENKKWDKIEPKALFVFALTDDLMTQEGDYQGKMKHVNIQYTQTTAEMGRFYKEMIKPLNLKLNSEGELDDGGLQGLLNMPVQVTIIHTDEQRINKQTKKVESVTYANIAGFGLVLKTLQVPEADTTPYFYSLEDHNDEVFSKLPKWIQNKINFSGTNVPVKGADFK